MIQCDPTIVRNSSSVQGYPSSAMLNPIEDPNFSQHPAWQLNRSGFSSWWLHFASVSCIESRRKEYNSLIFHNPSSSVPTRQFGVDIHLHLHQGSALYGQTASHIYSKSLPHVMFWLDQTLTKQSEPSAQVTSKVCKELRGHGNRKMDVSTPGLAVTVAIFCAERGRVFQESFLTSSVRGASSR